MPDSQADSGRGGRLDPDPIPRRDFLGLAGLWTAGVAMVGSLIGMARLPKPRVLSEVSARFRVGMPSEFPPGTVTVIADRNVRVISTTQGVAALLLVCTHLGCIVKDSELGFECPCHGSKFDHEGKVTGGPAPRPLIWLAVSQAADGNLVVDKDKEVPANEFYAV